MTDRICQYHVIRAFFLLSPPTLRILSATHETLTHLKCKFKISRETCFHSLNTSSFPTCRVLNGEAHLHHHLISYICRKTPWVTPPFLSFNEHTCPSFYNTSCRRSPNTVDRIGRLFNMSWVLMGPDVCLSVCPCWSTFPLSTHSPALQLDRTRSLQTILILHHNLMPLLVHLFFPNPPIFPNSTSTGQQVIIITSSSSSQVPAADT